MKKGRLNRGAWMRMMACSLLLILAPAAFAQEQANAPAGSIHQPKDKAAIHKDVQLIRDDNQKISAIRTQMRQDQNTGNKRAVVIEKKDLSKACADKKRDAAHLKADRKNVKRDDNLAIRESKKAIRRDKAKLAHSRHKLHKKEYMRQGDSAVDIENQSDRVTYYRQKLDQDKERLKHQRRKKEEDLTFMRKEEKRLQEKQSLSYTAR